MTKIMRSEGRYDGGAGAEDGRIIVGVEVGSIGVTLGLEVSNKIRRLGIGDGDELSRNE